jgi:hypothetical protein
MPYLYETHLHTSQGSACGISRGREYISRYKDLGYTGIFVTDHFYRGNSAIGPGLPWEMWVDYYCRGYEDAREEGARRGLDVFFAWEETYNGDDYLIYGLDREWLLAHPGAASWSRQQQFDEVSRAGGCVVHAHPFRQHHYIRRVTLAPALVHAVEAANGGNHDESYDALAWAYAKKQGLPVTAGSDIHDAEDVVEDVVFGVYLDQKIKSAKDYAAAVRANALSGLKFPQGRCNLTGNERLSLPAEILDANGQATGEPIMQFLGLED